MPLDFTHVDVFTSTAYSGNSLAVFTDSSGLTAGQMLRITRELHHFESIFLVPTPDDHTVRAHIYDFIEELPFAGHPILGAAAVLHRDSGKTGPLTWQFVLTHKTVSVVTQPDSNGYSGWLDQGAPEFLGVVGEQTPFVAAFSLDRSDLIPGLPLEVASTGLRYLVIPVRGDALARARIMADISELLIGVGAKFAVLFDVEGREIRHWANDGSIEDVATGSAAGVVGAYTLRHGLARGREVFELNQGRFTGRPSILRIRPDGTPTAIQSVKVGGNVAFVGHGTLLAPPE